VTVLVARDRGGSAAGVCFYLVDTWCLGLKDAAGPRPVDRRRLGGFIQQIFSAWGRAADRPRRDRVRARAGTRAAPGLRADRRVSGGMGRRVRATWSQADRRGQGGAAVRTGSRPWPAAARSWTFRVPLTGPGEYQSSGS